MDLSFAYFLISSVFIMTVMWHFLSSVDSDVGIDIFSTVIGYLTSHNRNMIYSGFLNSRSTYCFGFSLNLLNWYFDSLCSAIVPNTVPKYSTSSLNFLIDDVCASWLKFPLFPSCPQ